ncbi:MAG: hypothetical protein JSU81_06495 [Candidatus Coatesbacteria bacterium]|nr:MAG: hypothetical protein JSU81_06495 [Candidatus Coatesbacteria bacterium]
MLENDVRRNEAAGRGDIEEQTRALLDAAVRLEEEAVTLENVNAALVTRYSK